MDRTSRFRFLLAALMLLSGCASQKRSAEPSSNPPASEKITNTDPCAMRLHDICGALLLYYVENGDLPADLSALESSPVVGADHPPVCPVSKLRYVYEPAGIFITERNRRIILFDAAPSHSGMRWAVTVDEPQPGMPLVTRVVSFPESLFLMHPVRK